MLDVTQTWGHDNHFRIIVTFSFQFFSFFLYNSVFLCPLLSIGGLFVCPYDLRKNFYMFSILIHLQKFEMFVLFQMEMFLVFQMEMFHLRKYECKFYASKFKISGIVDL